MNNNGVENENRKPEAILESEVDKRSITVTVPAKKTSAKIETVSRRISVDEVFGMRNVQFTLNCLACRKSLGTEKKPETLTCKVGRKPSTNGTSYVHMTAEEEEALQKPAKNQQTS